MNDGNINMFTLLRKENKKLFGDLLGSEEYTSYNSLILQLKEFKNNDEWKDIPLYNILTGENMSLINQKCAIYEIPTFELVVSLFKIASKLNASIFYEMFAGTGILSRAVSNYNNKITEGFKFNKIICTDGNYEWNTSGYKFHDVQQQCFMDLICKTRDRTAETVEEDSKTMYVFMWSEHYLKSHIKHFLNYVSPKCLVVIDNGVNLNESCNEDYSFKDFHIKQLCYRDHELNYDITSKCSHSHVSIFYKKIDELNDNDIEDTFKLTAFNLTYCKIVEDMSQYNKHKKEIYDHILTKPLEISNKLKKLNKYRIFKLPIYLVTIEDFERYVIMCDIMESRLSFKNNESLNDAYELINEYIDCTEEKFNQAKKDGLFPLWLHKNEITKYLINEYTGVSKNKIFNRSYS